MMLQALYDYAERRMSEDPDFFDPDFRWVDVSWQIDISAEGKLNALIPLEKEVISGKKKRREKKKVKRPYTDVNEISVRSPEKAKSYFLSDTIQRIFLYAGQGIASDDPLTVARRNYFIALMQKALNAGVANELLKPLVSFLLDEQQMIVLRERLDRERVGPDDSVVFSVDMVGILDNPEIQKYWRKERELAMSNKGKEALCIVSGQPTLCDDTTGKIKGIGKQDTIFVSANESAYCSYGFEKAQNSSISRKANGFIEAALNDLIARSNRQSLVYAGTWFLHWTREPVDTDAIGVLTEADPEAVAALLHSVREGRQQLGMDENAYYAMSLSGNGARIVVRDWLESTVPEVRRNIAHWFEDLAIVSQEDGRAITHDFKFYALLYAMVRDKPDELPPNLSSQLWNCALKGRGWPVPETCLCACLKRQQAEADNRLNPRRMALIKLCLLRLNNPSTTKVIMTEKLDSDCNDPAYLCGRLFAVFDRLQY
ncbi:MAG: type I-C CRISPR-associated protein Cas8c/Csd1, partial [Opitutales bacterium]|nr:type I-C CRISPR-associated protein Cas8c/Csd1 [Opitutales bacterium]